METLNFLDDPRPVADAAPAPSPRTEVATAAAAAVDLTKVSLADVALAQFGDWRGQVKAANTALKGVVHDLSTVAKIGEAKSLRWRLIGQPVADARKVSKAVKSELAAVSKTVGQAEVDIVKALEAEAAHITPQIEAAEQRIEAERIERERLAAEAAAREAERVAAHRANVETIRGYVAQAQGQTAEKLAIAVAALHALEIGEAWQEFAPEAEQARRDAVQALQVLHQAAEQREAHERAVQAQAAENARIAAELAEQKRLLDEQAAALRREQEAEARRAEQRTKTYSSGAPMYSATHIKENGDLMMLDERGARSIFYDLDEGYDPQPTATPTEPVLMPSTAPAAPAETVAGKAENPAPSEAAPITQDAQESGSVPADAPASYASNEPEAAGLPSGHEGAAAPAECAAASMAGGVDPDTDDLPLTLSLDAEAAIRALVAHIEGEFRATKFPTQPKPGVEWWAELRQGAARVKALMGAVS